MGTTRGFFRRKSSLVYPAALVVVGAAFVIDRFYSTATFIPLVAALIGALIGTIGGYRFNRKVRWEDQWLQLNLRKFESLNRVWKAVVNLQGFIQNNEWVIEHWNIKAPEIRKLVEVQIGKIDEAYSQIDFLMSVEMGELVEYIGKFIIQPFFYEPDYASKKITGEGKAAFIGNLEKYSGLMMGLLKIECNAMALEYLLYGRFEKYEDAISDWESRKDDFIKIKHKAEFDKIHQTLTASDQAGQQGS